MRHLAVSRSECCLKEGDHHSGQAAPPTIWKQGTTANWLGHPTEDGSGRGLSATIPVHFLERSTLLVLGYMKLGRTGGGTPITGAPVCLPQSRVCPQRTPGACLPRALRSNHHPSCGHAAQGHCGCHSTGQGKSSHGCPSSLSCSGCGSAPRAHRGGPHSNPSHSGYAGDSNKRKVSQLGRAQGGAGQALQAQVPPTLPPSLQED